MEMELVVRIDMRKKFENIKLPQLFIIELDMIAFWKFRKLSNIGNYHLFIGMIIIIYSQLIFILKKICLKYDLYNDKEL